MPPFLQGVDRQLSVIVAHVEPLYPVTQAHVYPDKSDVHEPPLTQGLDKQ